jgi:hypothetical protein
MPTHNSHTHCQVAQADTQAKTWQRVCLSQRTADRQLNDRKEGRTANSGFKKLAVQWLIEHSTSHQHLWWLDSLVLRNRQLLKPAKR